MNLDLFADAGDARLAVYRETLDSWLADEQRAGRLRSESSADVYAHMWLALSSWAIGHGIPLQDLRADDLERYLASRGDSQDLSARYALRLLRLTGRVLCHRSRTLKLPPNMAAEELLAQRPDLRYAEATQHDELPQFLLAAQAKRLVSYLSAVRPGRGAPGQPWQEVRNRASVGLMLGSGMTPGELRELELDDIEAGGGRRKDTPWKLRVASGVSTKTREAPVAPWAGQLLKHWLEIRAEQSIPGSMAFPSTRSSGKAWGKVSQYNATREVLLAAGLDDPEGGSFRLRHTFALRQLRRGTAPAEIARWLGVVDPSVMERYSRVLTAPADVV